MLVTALFVGSQSNLFAQPCSPFADFTYTVNGCDVEFTPNTFGPGILHFWTFRTFDSGGFLTSASNIETPVHTFGDAPPGIRVITHTVTIAGVIYTCTKYITVNCNSGCLERDFIYVVNGCTVNFSSTLGGTWFFGDGSSSTLQNPTHTYAVSGTYIVSYTNAYNGNTCRKTIRVVCDQVTPCCTAAFTGEVKRECSILNLSLGAECTTSGTHLWTIMPINSGTCISLSNFFQGMPTQGMIQITNINTCEVTALRVTHQFTCSNGTVLTQTQVLPIQDQGIFIGIDGATTPLTNYNCVLPGSLYNGACTVYSSGIVTVDKVFTFSSANVRVQPGLSGFDVIKNFTLNQNTLVSGNAEPECNCLWRGIYVYGANTMTTGSDASIQDALYAIRAHFKNTLDIRKTLFARNYIGIRATDGGFHLPFFEENRFDGNGPLKNICSLEPLNDVVVAQLGSSWCDIAVPYQSGGGFAGMYLRDAGNVGLPPLAYAQQNLFYNLAVGIDANDTELRIIRNSRFQNISPSSFAYDIPYGGMAIRYVDTDNQGINGFLFTGNGKFYAGAPDFDNCIFGTFITSRISASVYTGTRVAVSNSRFLGAHNGVFLSNNCGLNGTFTGSKSTFSRGGIWDNYIEVNPSTGDQYITIVMPLTGIALTDFDPGQSAPEIWQNTIDVNQDNTCGASFGIRASGFTLFGQSLDQVDINKNEVNLNAGLTGISLSNYAGAWVHDNSDNAFPGAGVFLNYQHSHLPQDCGNLVDFSIGIASIAGFNNLVGCNDVLSTPHGNHDLVVVNHNNGTFVQNFLDGGRFCARLSGAGSGTRFACNTMSGYTENGLLYNGGSNIGAQGATFTMTHGNVWVNFNPALDDAFIDLTTTIPLNSRFYVRNIAGEIPITNSPGWFTANVPNGITPTCYYDCPITSPQLFVSELTSGDSSVASETIIYGYYPETSEWIGKRNLLEKLAQNPSLSTNNSLMTGFTTNLQNTAMARLMDANSNINRIFALTNTQKNDLESYAQITTALLLQLNYLDSLAHSGLDMETLEVNNTQHDSLASLLEEVQHTSDSLAHILTVQRLNEGSGALTDLENILPSNVYETNEKYVLETYLKALNSNNQPSANTIDSLYNIGLECPMINGPCVYNARALYEKFTGIILLDVDCPAIENRSDGNDKPKNTMFSDIFLYPNPANDVLVLKLPESAEFGNYQLSISNTLGEVLLNVPVYSVEHQISTSHWPNGVYFVKIIQNNTTVMTTSVFIQH